MKHPAFQVPIALLLALLLLFGGTAKEFVHQFAGHVDTVHTSCSSSCADTKEGLAFGPKHHHCEFLMFILAAFDAPPVLVWNFRKLPALPSVRYIAAPEHLWTVRSFSFVQGRGPPSAAFS